MMTDDSLTAKLERIKLLLLDVDGVLTDGKVIFSDTGQTMLAFDVKDGSGIKYARMAGLEVGIVTGKKNDAVLHRARELGITILYREVPNKASALKEILRDTGFRAEEVLFMGDDLLDLAAMNAVGVPVAVADAAPELIEAAAYVTSCPGGNGAVREVCELSLIHI